jgi:outer membrane protein TolC
MRIVRYPPPRRQWESEGGLAQARYRNGISSIVEFNQAQLNLLSAQITYADTQYEYLLKRSALSFQTGSLG